MSLSFVYNPYLDELPENPELFKETFGIKSFGLLKILEYTPYFILISNELFKLRNKDLDLFNEKLIKVTNKVINAFGSEQPIIIRSSGVNENINQRGLFLSEILPSSINKKNLSDSINTLYSDFEINKVSEESTISLIVQAYINPIAKGHLSNERRVSRNNDLWVYEIEEAKEEPLRNIDRLRSRRNINLEKVDMKLDKLKNIEDTLRDFSAIFIDDDKRFHFEWVYGDLTVYIVQVDEENRTDGKVPGSRWKYNKTNVSEPLFKVLKSVFTHSSDWKKLKSVETFKKCNLPHGNIYILNDITIFEEIANDVFNSQLVDDLKSLLHNPVVIRTDCNEMDNTFLLPRTTTLSHIDQCKDFLFKTLLQFKEDNVPFRSVCFLLHNYISSKSCALTLARPDIPKVKIDSTWGLPDGLHCFPYDTFEVNLNTQVVKKKLNPKYEYLDCNSEGDWIAVKSGWNWDWKASLTDEQLDSIASYSYEVAKELNKPVGIMFFVGVDESSGYPEVLPWYHTLEIPESTFEASEIIFPKNTFTISEPEELNQLKQKELLKDIVVKLKLKPNHIRNNKFIVEIGQFLSKKNIPLILEGSILSHVFYILKRENVNLKCLYPFQFDYPIQSFNKLVRDLIPSKISLHGELPTIHSLSRNQLIEMLKGKAIEEAHELFREHNKDNILEEMADLYEILISLSALFGENFERVVDIADKKRTEKGGFNKGLYLISTTETPLIKKENQLNDKLIINQNFVTDLIEISKSFNKNKVEFKIPLIPPKGNRINTKVKIEKQVTLDFNIEYQKDALLIKINKISFNDINPNQLKLKL